MGRKSGSEIRFRDEQPGSYFRELKFFDADPGSFIQDGKNSDPG
jgi:hypothetical protein